jgi:photosystem II stability/assembly factor-like uncharacterized protein
MKRLPFIRFFSLALLMFSGVFAHWNMVNGLSGGRITQLSGDGKNFFAAVDKSIYALAGFDSRWEPINFEPAGIYQIFADQQTIFAVSNKEVSLSMNGGESWKSILSGNYRVNKAITSGKNILFIIDGVVWISQDNGVNWRSSEKSRWISKKIANLAADDSTIISLDSNNNICYSLNHGMTWRKTSHPADIVSSSALAVKNGLILLGADNGLYGSSDRGSTWKCLYLFKNAGENQPITDIAMGEDYVLIATRDGILSLSKSQKWKAADSGLTCAEHLLICGDTVLAGGPNGIFVSPDRGITWGEFSLGLENSEISTLTSDNGHLIAGTETGNIFSFTPDSGWNKIRKPKINSNQKITALFARDSTILAGSKIGLLYSNSSGRRWGKKNLEATGFLPLTFSESDSEVFLGGQSGVYLSVIGKRLPPKTDSVIEVSDLPKFFSSQNNIDPPSNRKDWERADFGIEEYQTVGLLHSRSKLYAGTYNGFYSSSDKGKTWEKKSDITGLRSLAVTRVNVLLAIQDSNKCLMASGDGGRSWLPIRNLPQIACLAVDKGIVFAGATRGVFYSFDCGNDWINFSNGLSRDLKITSLTIMGGNIYCGTNGNNVWQRSLSEITAMEMPDRKGCWPYSFSVTTSNQSMKVNFSISHGDYVSLILYAVRGEKTISSVQRRFTAGEYSNPAAISSLNRGVYLCQIKTGRGFMKTEKFFLEK